MTPFAMYLRELRNARGLLQKEMAELLGYEQSYVSGMEIGAKGPPKKQSLAQMARKLHLDEKETRRLYEAADNSRRSFNIPTNSSARVYEICHTLEKQLPGLEQTQLELIELALRLNLCKRSEPLRSVTE